MTEHTQGPWIEGIDGNNSVYGPDGMGRDSGLIATVYKGRGNIRLISAAPDMYEALKVFAELAKPNEAFAPEWSGTEIISVQVSIGDLRSAVTAISKAEGKS